MIIVDIKIGIDGIPSEKNILLGNKYENNDTIINFELPSDFDNYNKYVIAVNGSESRIIPVLNNRMTVSSALTELAGNWAMYLMCRETSIDLSQYVPDISAKDNEHVFISDGFIGTVVNVQIDKRTVERIPLDTNLKIVYDDLMNLRATIIEQVKGLDAYYEKTNISTEDIANLKTNKVDKVSGKGLSTEDYTTEEKSKLAGLSNYDDSTVKQDIANLKTNKVDKVVFEDFVNNVNTKFIESGLGILRTGKLYGVKVWKSASNPSTILEKTRDNANLVCEPSTDTVAGVDDYADIQLFQWAKCNYKRYDDGFAYPVAIEGDGNYKETGDVDCGAIQPTFWYGYVDSDEYKELIISDSPNNSLGLKPWEQAVRADGTVMPYFIQSRYPSVIGSDGLLHSQPGNKISRVHSHNSMITSYQKKGAGYWGAGSDRYTFAQIFMMIKYGVKSIQKKMNGVCSWNIQYKASVESDVPNTYFPVTNAQADSLQVGLCVSVGYGQESSNGSVNLDRGIGTMHAYADDVKILKIEPLDADNKAVYLDCEPFTTSSISGQYATQYIYMSSMHAHAGDTDSVIGHRDGSPVSNSDGKHPFRIQGIEYLHGAWIVASDTVMFFKEDYSKDVYRAPRGVAHSTNDTTIKETYTLVGNIIANNGSDFWVGDVDHVDGVWFPTSVVSSDQQGMGDRCYAGGQSTSGSREYLQGGGLGSGSVVGLACLDCRYWLWDAVWLCASAD